ncbi:hypothetical protein [Phytopseudomonas dryadis]|uniref:DUF3396 domain-containing protein n=1 Tax=Phytopseudomonas dryadis TaxID=2487520 RepID=A0A4Q9QNV5_9GAMM|nr:hypothetical protein [Pseudomonas dryadis]TBU81685.1 hypothetical protein DNK44_26155 [Pseudomonas dryadis]
MNQPPRLSLWQKRQATLIYHFASLDYLKGLLPRLNALLQYADDLVDQRKVVDAYMVSERWGTRDTSANWSTCAWPALADFREKTLADIAERAHESYGRTGASHCARMLDEYSMMWMTHEQEALFKQRFEEVCRYAGEIDGLMGRLTPQNDYTFWFTWQQHKHLFPRLPRFRVHTSVIGQSGQVPSRTGVYMPMDAPHGALQFAWTGAHSASGHRQGKLIDSATFNDLGLAALQAVGRKGLWGDKQGLIRFVQQSGCRPLLTTTRRDEQLQNPRLIDSAIARHAFQSRPCQWHFVELLEGEYEESDPEATDDADTGYVPPTYAGQPCPRTGYWSTPAQQGSRRQFEQGEVLPSIPSETSKGLILWQWDTDQGGN